MRVNIILKKGISVLVVNTDKARDLLNRVSKDFIYGLIDPMERAVPCNLAFTKPPPRNEKKASFLRSINPPIMIA